MESKSVPSVFVSLQKHGYRCENYYTGNGGKKIGLTEEILRSVGLADDTLWVHHLVLTKLELASRIVMGHGYNILIKDAWRPVLLYDHIIRLNEKSGLPTAGLLNGETKPHSTGMAIDVVLLDIETNHPVMMRNGPRDGVFCCFVDFYRDKTEKECVVFQSLQDILVNSFLCAGFQLGTKKEYWHFELPEISIAPRF